jgi:hypothetical protein
MGKRPGSKPALLGLVAVFLLCACSSTGASGVTATPEPQPEGYHAEGQPPPVVLEIDGQEQNAGIGSYCWAEETAAGTGVQVCADMVGVPTAQEPLLAPLPFTARFRLSVPIPPDELTLEDVAVTAQDELVVEGRDERWWHYQAGTPFTLPLTQEPEIELFLSPGLHLLTLFARWSEFGDVTYGFLVQVQLQTGAAISPVIQVTPATAAGLTIEEYPIVADDVIAPYRFEFNEYMPDEILARRAAWRNQNPERYLNTMNERLALFDYQLAASPGCSDCYDVFHGQEKLFERLGHVWPVSVNKSGTDFVFMAENAMRQEPLYFLVYNGRIEPLDLNRLVRVPPIYVGDDLVTVVAGDMYNYEVCVNGKTVYSHVIPQDRADIPVYALLEWQGRWGVEFLDQVIVDGASLNEQLGYRQIFNWREVHGQLFYFFTQGRRVHVSYAGQTLPQTYDEVVHNQCCEPSFFNVHTYADMVAFYALKDGVWYYVEMGVYEE